MIQINSYSDLVANIKDKEKAYILIYKLGNEKSDCAYNNLLLASKNIKNIPIMYADVNNVKNIHTKYNITTAPALIEFENGSFKNIIKGCQNEDFYRDMFENVLYYAQTKKEGETVKRVTVYSTPSCSWCTTLKTYLKQHKIRFTDIDVSRDQRMADELMKRSGQMGVPQTEINGEFIIGFNKPRINELLNING